MTRAKRVGWVVAVALAVAAACVAVVAGLALSSRGVQARVAYEIYLDDPEMMTLAGIGGGALWDVWSPRLTDASPARTRALVRRKARLLRQLEACEAPPDGTPERLSHDIVASYLEGEARLAPFAFHGYLVDSYEGEQKTLIRLLTEHHPLATVGGAEAYVARLRRFPAKVDSLLLGLEERSRLGIVAPAWSLAMVAAELRGLLADPPGKDVLCTAFAAKVAQIEGLPEAKRQRLLAAAVGAVAGSVYPSFERLLRQVEALERQSPPGDGVWRLPDGAAHYAALLRLPTSTELTADEIHTIGVREVARLESELDLALRALGNIDGSPAERLRALAADPRHRFAAGEAGREEVLAAYRGAVGDARAVMAGVLDRLPPGAVEVRPVPEREAATAEAAHGVVRRDGMVLFVNAARPETVPRFSVRTLAFHEALPGHWVQRGMQRSLPGVPMIRRVLPFTAFAEGWAMYAERLSRELGLVSDPYDDLGRLQGELWRAARLVVDTGIHHHRWSRERAIEVLAATTGLPDPQVEAEVERYVLDPGQACAYMIGMLRFLAMRDAAKAVLGERFAYPEFHRALLENGPMPLPMIERRMQEWVQGRAAAGAVTAAGAAAP